MRYSIELELLIEIMKVSLLEHNTTHLKTLLGKSDINWQRFEKMAVYHAIRPLVFDACNKVGFENNIIAKFRLFCFQQTAQNLIVANELRHLKSLFQNHNIEFLLYKGLLFLEKLYDNKPFREIGDLDILCKPSDVKNALKILFDEGYLWSEKINLTDTTDTSINQVLTYFGREAELKKDGIVLDFHWGIYETFREFNINVNDFFNEKEVSTEKLLKLMLVHHAGRDSWTKLKYIADLIMFLKKYQNEIDWKEIYYELGEWKIQKTSFYGIGLGAKILSFDINDDLKNYTENYNLDYKTTNFLIDFWEVANEIRMISDKVHYLKIFGRLQDSGFSMTHYLYRYFKANSIPNPIEQKRVITFPDNYPFLNFISKTITILLRKTT